VLAVHAREGSELEQDDAVAKGREPQRLAVRGVEPRIDADQFGSAAENSQPGTSVVRGIFRTKAEARAEALELLPAAWRPASARATSRSD
jgi:hypothetical protein